jgi:hypothetical protein
VGAAALVSLGEQCYNYINRLIEGYAIFEPVTNELFFKKVDSLHG